MKVYIILQSISEEYKGVRVIGVYSTRSMADSAWAKLGARRKGYFVDSFELIE
jgi:hypothetical protein